MLFPSLANNPKKDPNIGILEKFSYGLGDFASNIMYAPTGAILIYYYTEFVGVNIAIVATLMLISRCLDGFSDIFMGYIIEKTKSPYGRARVWIIRMLIPFFIALLALFSVPSGMSDFMKYVYIFVTYNLSITVVYTAINLPYGALTTMMTKDSYQRSIITIYRMLLATAGGTITTAVTFPMVEFFGNDQLAWTITFGILGIIACGSFFMTFAFCHERIEAPAEKHESGHLLQSIKGMFKNKFWLLLTIAMVSIFAADIVCGTATTYYARYFLKDPAYVGTFAVINSVVKVAAMIILLPLCIKGIGKRNSLVIASLIICVAMLLRYIDPYNVWLAYIIAGLTGFGMGFTYALMFSMIPDTIEYGEFQSHERHEGLFYAGASFGTKVASGLGTVIASFTMQLGGYINNAPSQTPEAMNSILLAITVIPVVMYAVGLLCLSGYGLDKIYNNVIAELSRRNAINNAPELDLEIVSQAHEAVKAKESK